MNIEKLNIPTKSIITVAIAVTLFFSSVYTVNEGHIGIVKRFSEAKEQVNPGLHFKVPFIDSVEEIEVRTRKNEEKMASSTKEQMPVTVIVSVNWTVDKTAALELFRQYGGLKQFENRILDPRFRSATKDVIPQYDAEKLIQDRASAIQAIEASFIEEMKDFPVTVDNIQIENIQLPAKYLTSIETKQTEKNLADAEKHKLARQNLEAQRDVNTAKAKADGIKLVAIAEAESIRIKGLAEAEAITAKAKALGNNPLIVKLTEAQNWDGKLPATILGSSNMPILDMRVK
ncbi:prohibitin family protein [Colwellia sp. BRX10-1]|nr:MULTISPECIES: prohibitin family protein [unclassified Colwellia]MBA6353892.1 prohibitin family protein [Colwellia sp. BRX9-1]MBA6378876.1 prohibitin family protein [Colwellia sp. BRX10-7]MBA6388388.1 prohibitin family protein [Colwellia sp. BRX10-2]MBA6400984.1 prohibitin family protein [Colwellia sp. BRX10-5]MBA6405599.1 prohibitin family protein [Colwellia sp. BRX10-1]